MLTLQEAGASRAADEWCRGESAPLARGDRQRFPYAVVEIKLQGAGQPAWIRRLVDSGGQHLITLVLSGSSLCNIRQMLDRYNAAIMRNAIRCHWLPQLQA